MTLLEQYDALPPAARDALVSFARALATLSSPETPEQRAEVDRLYVLLRQGPASELAHEYLANWQRWQDWQTVLAMSRELARQETPG